MPSDVAATPKRADLPFAARPVTNPPLADSAAPAYVGAPR